jgi:hypothetical protein
VTAFRSPRTASAFTESIPGSTFLACHFAPRTVAHKLVRPSAPLPVSVRPASGRFFASARRLLASAPDQPLLRPPLPFGIVTSLGIKAFCRARCQSVRLPVAPDFLSLPASVFLLLVVGSGSMFQVRYVSGGLLFLKPLGTSLTMRQQLRGVKDFETGKAYFQQVFICFVSMTYGRSKVDGLWIKHDRSVPSLRY